MKHTLRYTLIALGLTAMTQAWGQRMTWHDPQQAPMQVLMGQAWPQECRGTYQRFPESRRADIPAAVWGNAQHSAGLSLRFHTLARHITVKLTTANKGTFAMRHMPAMGVSGVDLYELDKQGHTYYCEPKYSFGDTITYVFHALDHHHGGDYELYLPLYNKVTWLNVGVAEGEDFHWIEAQQERPILVYGTSIAHGGCASRTGMAWPSIVKRTLNRPVVNWGFSGSGKMEKEMWEQMRQVDAAVYIIDCMPNMTGPGLCEEIFGRMTTGVRLLREQQDAPILIVEHDGYTGEATSDSLFHCYDRCNQECLRAYKQLKKEGVKGLYYLSHKEIGMPADGLVDGVHSTDLGMMVYAKAYLKKLKKLLH